MPATITKPNLCWTSSDQLRAAAQGWALEKRAGVICVVALPPAEGTEEPVFQSDREAFWWVIAASVEDQDIVCQKGLARWAEVRDSQASSSGAEAQKIIDWAIAAFQDIRGFNQTTRKIEEDAKGQDPEEDEYAAVWGMLMEHFSDSVPNLRHHEANAPKSIQ